MPEEFEKQVPDELDERIISAFESAYPDVPRDDLLHIAKNFTQVVRGIVDIGEKLGGVEEPTHMDIANSLVYWCVINTRLEDLQQGEWDPALASRKVARISEEEMRRLTSEFVARAADWLIGMEVLKHDPELFDLFIRGATTLGAPGWERNRGELDY